MTPIADLLLMVLILTGLTMLGASRLDGLIRLMAVQGLVVAVLPVFAQGPLRDVVPEVWGLALITAAIKGFLFPLLLRRALRKTSASREVEPFVGVNLSVLLGIVALGLTFGFASRLPLPPATRDALVVPSGLFILWTGLFLICARRKAITQVVGFITLENGIYTLGVALVRGTSWIIELGVLLDVFVGVFIMGIVVFHIGREFDDLDTSRLDQLKDAPT